MPITTVATTLQSCSLQGVMMKKKFLTAAALVGALAAPMSASAAKFQAFPIDCKGHPGCFLLTIDEDIVEGDGEKFEALIKKNDVKLAVVGLNSTGGVVIEAHRIGRLIQEKGYGTYVPKWGVCASACAMVWMAGAPRQYDAKARIGFHGAYAVDKKGKVIGATSGGNALAGSYYAHLGLSDPAILYMTTAGPKEMRWLTAKDAKEYGIDVVEIGEHDSYFVGPWPKEEAASNTPAAEAPTTAASSRFCVTIVPAPQEVRDDPEFDPVGWLTVREKPSQESKAITTTGAVGKTEADATDGEWTHLTNRGWVRTKYVQLCDGNA